MALKWTYEELKKGLKELERLEVKRRRAEERLKTEKAYLEQLFESAQVAIVVTDNKGRVIRVNREFTRLFGYKREEVIGQPIDELVALRGFCSEARSITRQVTKGGHVSLKTLRFRKDGTPINVSLLASPITVGDRQVAVYGIYRDETDRIRAEDALRESEEFNRSLLNNAPSPILVINPDTSIRYVNPAMEDITGFPSHELLGKKAPYPWWTEETKHKTRKDFREVIQKGARRVEELFQRKSGETFWVDMISTPVRQNGKVKYILSNWLETTQRKEAEVALLDSERRYRAVVEDMPAMICRFIPDGRITFVNRAFCDDLGRRKDEVLGQDFFEVVAWEDREDARKRFWSLNKRRFAAISERRAIAQDGSIRWHQWIDRALFDGEGQVIEYQSLGRDITGEKLVRDERARLEKQLRQAQKMESIGALARGIAHDFNNILWAVAGNIEFGLINLPGRSPTAREALEEALKSCERAKDLVRQIMTFSRDEDRELKPVELGPIIKETLKFLRSTLPTSIEIRHQVEEKAGLVNADPTQIYQVLMNLCVNAEFAMRENGGTLDVVLEKIHLEKKVEAFDADLHPGAYIRLAVKDSGHGIKPEIMEKIFDPYFTTKMKREGTGLGLSVVHGIVKGHKGGIVVESSPGKGSQFYVYLPVVEKPDGA
ncbi:MAG: PAS domain S-box protein [Deltaproteobacteria bacterium]|nr:PAS domain S-box protein [Deltaproteobacteria bacterium]